MNSELKSERRSLWLVCLKYAPGNWQHMESFAVRAQENGFAVKFVLSKCFSWMVGDFAEKSTFVVRSDRTLSILLDVVLFFAYRWIKLLRLLRKEKPDVVVLVMWHPLNAAFCLMAKLIACPRIIAWLHEPYKQDKLAYGGKAIVFYFVEWIQTLSMRWIDDIVVHSGTALRAFRKRYSKATQTVHLIPLQLKDQASRNGERRFISFLGKAARAKGIDKFFKLIELSASLGLGWRFAIATADNIDRRLAKLSSAAREKFEVFCEPDLSDITLREVASKSIAVLCLYTSSTQSGVVPIAFMCGTPVVATDIESLRASVKQGETGYFVPPKPDLDIVLEGLTYVRNNFATMSTSCRQEYLETYDDSNWKAAYAWLLNEQDQSNHFFPNESICELRTHEVT